MKFLLLFAACTGLLCAQAFDLKMPDTGAKTATASKAAKTSTPSLSAPAKSSAAPAKGAPAASKAASAPAAVPAAPAPKPGMPAVIAKADLTVEQVVAKARAAMGKDSVLDKVKAIEYVGTVADEKGQRVATFRYIYQKPFFLRREETRADGGYSALIKDDLEGWMLVKQPNGPLQRAMMPLGNQDFERDLAIDRLNFFKGPDFMDRATVALAGVVLWEGHRAYLLTYAYPVGLGKMTLSRVIDAETGRVLALLSNDGRTQAVDSGTLESGGIRFPKTTSIYQDGSLRARLTYDKVILNQSYTPVTFTTP